jgi:tetratricopeptide (TPR) repeat protein
MPRVRTSPSGQKSPEVLLRKATLAKTSGLRAKYAESGLTPPAAPDRTTRAMLLRQLYLSHMERRQFAEALEVSTKMVALDVMPDVARQDAARACLGLEDIRGALEHLRLASRVSPASRRAFHLWTLGSLLYLRGDHRSAAGVLLRASRWGTTDKPLYQAQEALARIGAGERVHDLDDVRERLADAPCGQGYGQFVLGELAYHLGDFRASRDYLRGFIRRSSSGREALKVALGAELTRARSLLSDMKARSARVR